MIKINTQYIEDINNSSSLEELYPFLQKAIELEHSTIPTYLTGMFSIKTGYNREIYRSLYSIVIEEMLHFTIACNILNAFGGKPQINNSSFVPNYPTTLPLNINNSFIVGLEKFSKEQLKKVYLEIEEPEFIMDFPKEINLKAKNVQPTFATIGVFYSAIAEKIKALNIVELPGNPELQVTSNRYSPDELFPILTAEDALKAIAIIVEQGEGTQTEPISDSNRTAHYYRFKEIELGRKLIVDSSVPQGYSYTGDNIEFDENGVYPLYPNTKLNDLKIDSNERTLAERFAKSYTELLNQLHDTFNGKSKNLSNTFGLMRELSKIAEELSETPYPDNENFTIGPIFEYLK